MISHMAGLSRDPLYISHLGSREDGGTDLLNFRLWSDTIGISGVYQTYWAATIGLRVGGLTSP